ncbi:glycoside hydrolase family 3 N-terminal domain-containing protein [Temperatibacter marinus]|uniref:Glycoside hydrolase family 3 N-terminal domain-containing protein n=1 Tax=Temperatibacter marinus TaxID=1456591 RepID=A0AA52EH61_9PROT|nr:glycoside hydrolase family 3 N-terminal domain-containing protein [Temperatibacter marinus]WND03583.1 glycoside hydrolase family 3 N-terminal domain-containing protein [Temperatibacter marinus]
MSAVVLSAAACSEQQADQAQSKAREQSKASEQSKSREQSAESMAETADRTPSLLGAEAWPKLTSPILKTMAQEKKIKDLLDQMSVEEKVGQIIQAEIQHVTPEDVKAYHLGSVLNGGGSMPNRNKYATPKEWLDLADAYYKASMDVTDGKVAIPIIWGSDAVHGHNNVIGATIFPHNIGLGAARNPALMRQIGRVTAREMRVTGIDWTFAPTLAVVQNDRWGRTYESFSEDPAVVKSYAGELVYGLQGIPGTASFLDGEHVVATAKHWLGDGGTVNGTDQGNTDVEEEELRDIHAAGYITALESGAQTAMASFSSWKGDKMHGHKYLMTDILKGQMGLDGLIVSDWNGHGQLPGCTNASCADAINAGIDLVMVIEDWKKFYSNTVQQVESGVIPTERLDDAVSRVLRVKFRAGLFDKGMPSTRGIAAQEGIIGSHEHKEVARDAVRQSLVLLKNNDNILPLKPGMKVLVAGDGAHDIGKQSGGWTITWQGTGNENSDFPGGQSLWMGLKEAIEAVGGQAILAEDGMTDAEVDVALVIYGEEPYAESQGDRETLEFEPTEKTGLPILKALKEKDIPTVSIFLSGRPMWAAPEMNASDAFVAAWLPGSEGRGVADVLVAKADGSINHDFKGRLSFSWPKRPDQEILNPHHPEYDPQFELGYGLRYRDSVEIKHLSETVSGRSTGSAEKMIYQGRTLASWKVFLQSGESRNVMSGAFGSTAERDLIVSTTDKEIQEDALTIHWNSKDEAVVGIFAFAGNASYDFSEIAAKGGVIALDVKIDQALTSPLIYSLLCGDECRLSVDLTQHLTAIVGQGWQRISVPFTCFSKDIKKFKALSSPMVLSTSGEQSLSVSNIAATLRESSNRSCTGRKQIKGR